MMPLYRRIVISFHYLPVRAETPRCPHTFGAETPDFAITGKQHQNVRKQECENLECEKIDQFAFSLVCNSKIVLGEFIFYYTINASANLKRRFTQIW